MRELERRQRIRRRLYSVPVLTALLLLTGVLTRGAYGLVVTEREAKREAKALAVEVEDLRQRERVLEEENVKLSTASGIEEEIKSKFNVVSPGEYVALIVEATEAEEATTTEKVSWWKRAWNAILGR